MAVIDTDDLEPLEVALKAVEKKELGYDWARVLVEVSGRPENGELQAWVKASSATDTNWYNVIKTGWGGNSEASKSSLAVDEDTTLDIYLFADTPGKYEVTFKAVEWSVGGQVEGMPDIASGGVTVNVLVGEISVSGLDKRYYAADHELEFTISGFSPDEEVRVGMPIFLGHGGGWPWASGEHVLTNNMEDRGDGLYWFSTTGENGVLTVSGTVGPDLPGGALHITLPDYGYTINNPIPLQDNHGASVRVGISAAMLANLDAFEENDTIAYKEFRALSHSIGTVNGYIDLGLNDDEGVYKVTGTVSSALLSGDYTHYNGATALRADTFEIDGESATAVAFTMHWQAPEEAVKFGRSCDVTLANPLGHDDDDSGEKWYTWKDENDNRYYRWSVYFAVKSNSLWELSENNVRNVEMYFFDDTDEVIAVQEFIVDFSGIEIILNGAGA